MDNMQIDKKMATAKHLMRQCFSKQVTAVPKTLSY